MKLIVTAFALLLAAGSSVSAAGSLSENQRIESWELRYDLQYRVYVPEGVEDDARLPTIYVTDGQWYIDQGRLTDVLDREIAAGTIKPTVAVFIDNRDPDNLMLNRRNQQFFCNPRYASFFSKELVPHISSSYPVSKNRNDRVILGVSFGGLNAACFGLTAHKTFGGIAMQSPANHPVKELNDWYKDGDRLPIKIFFSLGTKRDNTKAGRRFRDILKNKGYDLTYIEVPHGHNWQNWQPLLDDVLTTFFAK